MNLHVQMRVRKTRVAHILLNPFELRSPSLIDVRKGNVFLRQWKLQAVLVSLLQHTYPQTTMLFRRLLEDQFRTRRPSI